MYFVSSMRGKWIFGQTGKQTFLFARFTTYFAVLSQCALSLTSFRTCLPLGRLECFRLLILRVRSRFLRTSVYTNIYGDRIQPSALHKIGVGSTVHSDYSQEHFFVADSFRVELTATIRME